MFHENMKNTWENAILSPFIFSPGRLAMTIPVIQTISVGRSLFQSVLRLNRCLCVRQSAANVWAFSSSNSSQKPRGIFHLFFFLVGRSGGNPSAELLRRKSDGRNLMAEIVQQKPFGRNCPAETGPEKLSGDRWSPGEWEGKCPDVVTRPRSDSMNRGNTEFFQEKEKKFSGKNENKVKKFLPQNPVAEKLSLENKEQYDAYRNW